MTWKKEWQESMGTRGLTCVVKDHDYVMAKYNQFDSYPNGSGADLLKVLKTVGVETIKSLIDNLGKVSEAELELADTYTKIVQVTDKHGYVMDEPEWKQIWPWFTREWNGADVLEYLSNNPTKRINTLMYEAFAGDSLFCEWAYVVDFDENTFEVYKGVNDEGPVPDSNRFAKFNDYSPEHRATKEYWPVALVYSCSLNELPENLNFLEPAE